MEVIVTGGREFDDREMVDKNLSALKPTLVIEGGARGADRLARDWAKKNSVPFVTVDAEWSKLGLGAGHARNKKMIEMFPNAVLLAFPGNKGTANCVKQAEARKRTVIKATK